MNEQEIKEMIERIAALESKNASLENKFISLEKQIDTINKFMSAITESQSIETAMNEIESVTRQLTSCDTPDKLSNIEQANEKAVQPAERKSEVKYYNKDEYPKIENKFYLGVTKAVAYKIAQKAQAEGKQFSVKYNGDKSVVTLDGERDKAFIESVKKEFMSPRPEQTAYTAESDLSEYEIPAAELPYEDIPPDVPPQQTQQPEKKNPTFYNKDGYKDIQNKTFIETDAKTAYNVSKFAEKKGVEFSAKFDGKKSAVTVDGLKNKGFIETVKSMSAWSDKVQIKAAKAKERYQKPSQSVNRGR